MEGNGSPKSVGSSDWAEDVRMSFKKIKRVMTILKSFHKGEWDLLVQLGKIVVKVSEKLATEPEFFNDYQTSDSTFSSACWSTCHAHSNIIEEEDKMLFRNLVLEFCMKN
jgi:hypothetical protein